MGRGCGGRAQSSGRENGGGEGGVKEVRKKQGNKGERDMWRGMGTLAEFEEILKATWEQFKGEGALEGLGARGEIMEQGTTWVRARDQRGTKTVAEGREVGPKTGMVELANRYERIRETRGTIAAGVTWGVGPGCCGLRYCFGTGTFGICNTAP